jgi:hypothetical protein
MRKFMALLMILLCLVGSASADAYCTWGKVQEIDGEGNAILETLDGDLYAVCDGSLCVGMYLSIVIDEGPTTAKNDDFVVDYVEVESTVHPNLWKL